MNFLNLFKNLFFNEEIKSILPLVVSVACFLIIRNLFIIFLSNKKFSKVIINLFAIAITGIAYFSFIKILNLARYTYILDALPFVFYCISILLVCLKELVFVLYLFVSSNFLKISIFNYLDNCVIIVFYETIRYLVIRLKFKLELFIKQTVFLIQNLFYKHRDIYKLNCSFSC